MIIIIIDNYVKVNRPDSRGVTPRACPTRRRGWRAFWSDLRTRYNVRLTFGIFSERGNRGFELTGDAVSRIHSLGVGLDLDIYADLATDDDA